MGEDPKPAVFQVSMVAENHTAYRKSQSRNTKERPCWSHEPPLAISKTHNHMTGKGEKEGERNQREQKGGDGGSVGSDQDRKKKKKKKKNVQCIVRLRWIKLRQKKSHKEL